ncbi:hypothetical protein [Micromonospora sp. KC213]|uniref:hypothetical protein n=1 Tax=Micromonospora sp. KC213 TaxID=2530378 RepID=UPI001043F70C|nr:hypothetical protein [Micromonospora sp. KC213]TDC41903.1 hypothetical protein E1166_09855 [Micromonospora sp. KC213]
MLVSFASIPGFTDRPSEDFVAASQSTVVVLDGLTAPAELGTGCRHGTPWYVANLGTQLLQAASIAPHRPLADILAQSIESVANQHKNTCDLRHPGTPSAAVAMLRNESESVDYLVVFDCVIVLDGPAGLEIHTDLRVDGFAQAEHEATRKCRLGTPEHRDAVTALVAAQRPHRNQPDGYWVAAANPETAAHAVTGTRSHVDSAALLTDGASSLADRYHQVNWPQLLTLLHRHGPQHLIDRVRAIENTDPHGARWPRYKRSDDATAAYCLPGQPPSPTSTGMPA